jgi:hypothetical protein
MNFVTAAIFTETLWEFPSTFFARATLRVRDYAQM